MSRAKDKKDKKKKTNRRVIYIILVVLVLIVSVCVFLYSGTESARIHKAIRIAENYMKSKYDASLEYDNISGGIMMGADYTVYFKVSDTVTVYAGVSLENKTVVYENCVDALVEDKMNQSYSEKIESIWDKQAEVNFECGWFFEDDKYLLPDKKIDYDRAMHGEEFEVNITSDSFNLDQSAGAIYNTIVYLKENDVKISKIRFHDYSGDGLDDYKHYYLEDVDQFENADMVIDYLKNYSE